MKKIRINEIGNKYGKLTVVDFAKNPSLDKKGNARWLCKCDCGNTKEIIGYNLRGGHSKSCGCEVHKTKSRHQKWTGHNELSGTFFSAIRDGARHRNLEFDISIEYIWELFLKQNRQCALSGLVLTLPQKCKDVDKTASLDRIDSTKGYVKGNVQWIHKDINLMKWNLVQTEFINYCKLIYEKHTK